MQVRGMIFTAIDTEADNIEAWNRWYDIEHLPPNIALESIAHGRRYVAPPELHDIRLPVDPHPGFEQGKGVHVTVYLTVGDAVDAITAMTTTRDALVAAGRMDGAGPRTVRAGDALDWQWAVGDPAARLDDADVAWVAHTGLRVVLRRGPVDVADVAAAAVRVDGCHGVTSFASRFSPGLFGDFHHLEGDTAAVTSALRDAAPYPDDVEIVLDAPFDVIVPFDYAFADRIRASDLPQHLDTDRVLG